MRAIFLENREAVCRACDASITIPTDAFPEDEFCQSCKFPTSNNPAEIHVDDGEMEHLNGQFVHCWNVQIKRDGKVVNSRPFYHYTQATEFAERVASLYKLEEVY